jgi:hypothetical protein
VKGNRKFTRVRMSERASLKHGDHVFHGVVHNASLRGLFIHTDHDVPLDGSVEVSVKRDADRSAYFDARVVRKEQDGFGLVIRRMDISSFSYLRSLVAEQCHNPEVLTHETKMMVGHILSA